MQSEGEALEVQLQVLQAWYTFCAAKLRVFKVGSPSAAPSTAAQEPHRLGNWTCSLCR